MPSAIGGGAGEDSVLHVKVPEFAHGPPNRDAKEMLKCFFSKLLKATFLSRGRCW